MAKSRAKLLSHGGAEDAADGESFISHLVELRSRLVKAAVAVLLAFVCLVPFSSTIYDVMATPMLHALPEGTKMIASAARMTLGCRRTANSALNPVRRKPERGNTG